MTWKMIYNPSCSKSSNALNCVLELKEQVDIIDYMNEGVTAEMLNEIIEKSGLSVLDIVRTNEPLYQELFNDHSPDETTLFEAIIAHPVLLQRPIMINDKIAIITRDLNSLNTIFQQ